MSQNNKFIFLIPSTACRVFWITFLLCLLAGLAIIYIIGPAIGVSENFGKANDGYIQLAQNLGRGNGYIFEPDGPAVFHRPPLYPIILIPIMLLPEVLQWPALILLQSIMTALLGVILFKLTEKLFNTKTAAVATVIFLLNPWLYWYVKMPMTTIAQGLFYILFIWQVVLLFYNQDNLKIKTLLLALTAAALSLIHGAMLAACGIIFFVPLVYCIATKNIKISITVFTAGILTLLFVSPWTIRNYITFNRFIPVVSGSGLAYFNGNVHFSFTETVPQQNGETYIDASLRVSGVDGTEKTYTHWKGLKDITLDEKVNLAMQEDIKSDPAKFIKKVFANAVEYYFPAAVYKLRVGKSFNKEELLITVYNSTIWVFALLGSRCFNNKKIVLVLVGFIILYAMWYFPFATFIGHNLYTFATMPLLAILSAGLFTSRPYPQP
jgi:4-amino-4-deoxy-L-arabinose transferase-like glycosyltransferase